MPTLTAIKTRWMIDSDMPRVLAIERKSFDEPWTKEDFKAAMRDRDAQGVVLLHADYIVGYMVYRFHKESIQLINIAVAPNRRREGLGRAAISKLINRLEGKRNRLMLMVCERNLQAQKFFHACGLRATSVQRNFFNDGDGYHMVYDRPE